MQSPQALNKHNDMLTTTYWDDRRRFRNSFPKKYLPLRDTLSDLASELFTEVCKTGHFDSKRVRKLKNIGINWNLDPRGVPTGELSVRFHRQRPRVTTFQAAPPSFEELQDIIDAHAN